MIITLSNCGGCQIVSSAFYEKCTDLTSILVINTSYRNVPWDSITSDGDYLKVQYCYSDSMSEVWLYPEDDSDKKVLQRTRYELLCKSQQEFLFIDNSLIGG